MGVTLTTEDVAIREEARFPFGEILPASADEVLGSRHVVNPIRLVVLCALNEGSAAAVVRGRGRGAGDGRIAGAGKANGPPSTDDWRAHAYG
jgi:hypothetical protein